MDSILNRIDILSSSPPCCSLPLSLSTFIWTLLFPFVIAVLSFDLQPSSLSLSLYLWCLLFLLRPSWSHSLPTNHIKGVIGRNCWALIWSAPKISPHHLQQGTTAGRDVKDSQRWTVFCPLPPQHFLFYPYYQQISSTDTSRINSLPHVQAILGVKAWKEGFCETSHLIEKFNPYISVFLF